MMLNSHHQPRLNSTHSPLVRVGWICLALGALAGLIGCEKSQETGKAVEAQKPTEFSTWREWVAKGTDVDWWKQQWSKASEAAKAAKTSLDSINVEEVKKQAAEITKAIENQDFSKVESLAGELEKHLSVEKLGDGLDFIILQRQKGGEAAVKAIEEYAARQDLNEYEKAAATHLKKGMETLQRDDVRGGIACAIVFACECKFGSHEGAMIGGLIVTILFPDLKLPEDSSNTNPSKP